MKTDFQRSLVSSDIYTRTFNNLKYTYGDLNCLPVAEGILFNDVAC